MTGTLHLLPNALGDASIATVLPASVMATAARLDYFVGENAKSTRAYLNRIAAHAPLARPIRDIEIVVLDVSTPAAALPALLAPLVAGRDGGLVSEAGCPAVADPGAALVRLAHAGGVTVRPHAGPSSIMLALMASGLDGQRFAFNGYLPTDAKARADTIVQHQRRSRELGQTQIYIETPYRNRAVFDALVAHCAATTLVCVARDLTSDDEWISTRSVGAWKAATVDLDKRPTVFLMLSAS